MKVLQIVESAYRATVEEQDDTILWLTHVLKGAGAQIDVLLRGNAVNYAVPGQQVEGLTIGGWRQTQPPRIEHDLAALVQKGVRIFAVAEDLEQRGLGSAALSAGVEVMPWRELGATLARYQRVWHW